MGANEYREKIEQLTVIPDVVKPDFDDSAWVQVEPAEWEQSNLSSVQPSLGAGEAVRDLEFMVRCSKAIIVFDRYALSENSQHGRGWLCRTVPEGVVVEVVHTSGVMQGVTPVDWKLCSYKHEGDIYWRLHDRFLLIKHHGEAGHQVRDHWAWWCVALGGGLATLGDNPSKFGSNCHVHLVNPQPVLEDYAMVRKS